MYREMTEKELWQEDVWYHIQVGDYIVSNDIVYEYETGEIICSIAEIFE